MDQNIPKFHFLTMIVLLYTIVIHICRGSVVNCPCVNIRDFYEGQSAPKTVYDIRRSPETTISPQCRTELLFMREDISQWIDERMSDLDDNFVKVLKSEQALNTLNVSGIKKKVDVAMEYHRILQKFTQVTAEFTKMKHEYMMKLKSMKDYQSEIIHEMAKSKQVNRYLLNKSGLYRPSSILRSMQKMKLHYYLKQYATHPLLVKLKALFNSTWGTPSRKVMDFAIMISGLREKSKAFEDVVNTAAVEEIFLDFLRDGEFSKDHSILTAKMEDSQAKKAKKQVRHMDELGKLFLFHQVSPNGFESQKLKWIQEAYRYTHNINCNPQLLLSESRSTKENIIDQDISNNEGDKYVTVYDKIERLDKILMGIYLNRSLGLSDCNFVFDNVERSFFYFDYPAEERITKNSRYTEIGRRLLEKWGNDMCPTHPVDQKNTHPDLSYLEESLRARYRRNHTLFQEDIFKYKKICKDLMEQLERMHELFLEGSKKCVDEVTTVKNWYSEKLKYFSH